ncbi:MULTISPECIES: DUF3347 domain-containing protein [unclassified Pedobacter]|uniref:DUF3347 domain-containing protein n=1 Tax=unclassified Pedobacter TaxID=2628915 RepID=UPI001D7DA661|nr:MULTISPECIES: DUF3347 domain-containing protein [unclassified Pedobacter]CAH0173391.1 hypothetical protein SRABI126_01087 [Pedobacter sp. Bi126]CAH0290653.1 hypothetical protein SRABI36_04297 [Pedobacter sp. Bi36]
MKRLFKLWTINVLVLIVAGSVSAQEKAAVVNPLQAYYEVKDALISSNASVAGTKATVLINAIKANEKTNTSKVLRDKILFDAEHIAESKDIEHQRDHFTSLSTDFYALVKAVKLSDKPVYYAYCPMKKSYWLSESEAIKNPYYGSKMLTCGKVAEVLK